MLNFHLDGIARVTCTPYLHDHEKKFQITGKVKKKMAEFIVKIKCILYLDTLYRIILYNLMNSNVEWTYLEGKLSNK